ncbi:MAG: hypothetical protein NZ551_05115 [Microscillaceae bacterium]|nr:hypothetical protein [Microscillaceae bacterium]MDW8460575.1 adenylate/guanylate cyclase domain-containing protein [Cytophagales bacterium]
MNSSTKYSILIADKDIYNLHTIFEYLEENTINASFNVMNASNAETAILIARKKQPEIILLDWETAQAAEFDIIKNLKSVRDTSFIPIVLFVPDYQTKNQLKDFPCLQKPIQRQELYECLETILGAARNKQEQSITYLYKELQKEKQALENQLFEIRKDKELLALNLEKIQREKEILLQEREELAQKIANTQKVGTEILNEKLLELEREKAQLLAQIQALKAENQALTEKSSTPTIVQQIVVDGQDYINLIEYILPKRITQNLQKKEDLNVKLYESVGILVVQFEDTGSILARLGAEKTAQEIRNYFEIFDDIRRRYDLERIGSQPHQYICSTHLQKEENNAHNTLLLQFAIEIKNQIITFATTKKLLGAPTLHFSLSLQHGEILAGSIAKRQIAYDIWGDITQALPYKFTDEPYILASESFIAHLPNAERYEPREINTIITQRRGLQRVYQLIRA